MSKKIRTVNDNLELVTIDDIVNHKLISDEELNRDLNNLNRYDCAENENNFAGNRFLYHYQFANLLHCTRERSGKPRETIYEMWADPVKKAFLIDQTRKRNRGGKVPANNIFECYRTWVNMIDLKDRKCVILGCGAVGKCLVHYIHRFFKISHKQIYIVDKSADTKNFPPVLKVIEKGATFIHYKIDFSL
jgi:hypothetical protein